MSSPNPRMWLDSVFGNLTSLLDFFGAHAQAHDHIDAAILRVKPGAVLTRYPLGSIAISAPQEPKKGAIKVPQEWLLANQNQHVSEATALGLPGPGDMTSYDLSDKDQFIAFMLIHTEVHLGLNSALGL